MMSDLSGAWKIQIRFVRGSAEHSMQVEQSGDEIKGVYRSQYGARDLSGSISAGKVQLRVPVHYESVGTTYSFSGQLDGDVLRGEVDLGEYWTGTWEAQRVG
ncbi:MAG: hypothetical protein ACKVJG_15155 [Candidatus Latescibacterota bacterium]|jgi:hypothetical protein